MLDRAARHQLDAASGLLSFDADALTAYSPRRLKVLWVENVLDCRMWGYYCDIRNAMAKLHDLCTPSGGRLCMPPKFTPDIAIVGPRYSINIATADETVGFDRTKHTQAREASQEDRDVISVRARDDLNRTAAERQRDESEQQRDQPN